MQVTYILIVAYVLIHKKAAFATVKSTHWADGGKGSLQLADAVIRACEEASNDAQSTFKFSYELDLPLEEKIEIICKEIYGSDGVE